MKLDYQTPQFSPPDPERLRQLREMAGSLAIGATLWAIFCAPFMLTGSWRALLTFGPGYVVTAGYWWRALGSPSPDWCRAIWSLSLLVQGAWLGWFVLGTRPYLGRIELFELIFVVWWVVTTLVTLIALVLEPRRPVSGG